MILCLRKPKSLQATNSPVSLSLWSEERFLPKIQIKSLKSYLIDLFHFPFLNDCLFLSLFSHNRLLMQTKLSDTRPGLLMQEAARTLVRSNSCKKELGRLYFQRRTEKSAHAFISNFRSTEPIRLILWPSERGQSALHTGSSNSYLLTL